MSRSSCLLHDVLGAFLAAPNWTDSKRRDGFRVIYANRRCWRWEKPSLRRRCYLQRRPRPRWCLSKAVAISRKMRKCGMLIWMRFCWAFAWTWWVSQRMDWWLNIRSLNYRSEDASIREVTMLGAAATKLLYSFDRILHEWQGVFGILWIELLPEVGTITLIQGRCSYSSQWTDLVSRSYHIKLY